MLRDVLPPPPSNLHFSDAHHRLILNCVLSPPFTLRDFICNRWGTLSPDFDATGGHPEKRQTTASIRERLLEQGVHRQLAEKGAAASASVDTTPQATRTLGGYASAAAASQEHPLPVKDVALGEEEDEEETDHGCIADMAAATTTTCARYGAYGFHFFFELVNHYN